MTGLLKDTFTEEAEAIGEPAVDLAAIVATGNRRIKRRRLGSVLVAVAASAAVIGGGLTTVQHLTTDPEVKVAVGGPFAERRPTWADGKEIHFGPQVIRVPSAIASFVQTNVAFVYTTADGGVFRVAEGGATTPIGKVGKNQLLAADPDRGMVGWVDPTRPVPEFVVYNLVAAQEVARTSTGNTRGSATADPPVRVAAIDDGIAYFGASDGLRRWDIATGVGELIKPKAPTTFLVAAEAGQFLWENPAGGDTDLGVGKDVNAADPTHYEGWTGHLSPQARYLMTDKADVVSVVDLRSGKSAALTVPGYVLIVPTQWKDDHTFHAIGFVTESSRLDLLTCTIKSVTKTTCDTSVKSFAPPVTPKSTVQFPIGAPITS
ncbi:hypothetical protein AB0P21_35715 [Kribbella sp. NPDC056861]|uniref:hypothetical protein n=1 Tax=Kribbella sp. NPDC056861 TaxID=3154857 RepID=UPI00343B64C1